MTTTVKTNISVEDAVRFIRSDTFTEHAQALASVFGVKGFSRVEKLQRPLPAKKPKAAAKDDDGQQGLF